MKRLILALCALAMPGSAEVIGRAFPSPLPAQISTTAALTMTFDFATTVVPLNLVPSPVPVDFNIVFTVGDPFDGNDVLRITGPLGFVDFTPGSVFELTFPKASWPIYSPGISMQMVSGTATVQSIAVTAPSITAPTPIPEPAVAWLMGLPLAAIGLWQRRKSKRCLTR